MKITKKLLSLLLALSLVASMVACGDKEDPQDATGESEGTQQSDGTTGPADPSGTKGEKGVYHVNIQTAGGMKMEGVSVYVYTDDSKTDIAGYGETDAEGKVSMQIPKSDDMVVEIQGIQEGYDVQPHYSFTGNVADIVLKSSLITDKTLSDVSASDPMELGDVMYDFKVTTVGGEEISLSEVLKDKKMVLLNFWFSTCGPCANEFPYMHEAYQMYQEDAAVIAVDPLEDSNTVANYQASMGLTFPMASCPAAWSQAFNVSGYPTSVVIDRYGVICLIEVGGITSLSPFTSIFEHFTADDYEQKLCVNGVSDIMAPVKPTHTMDTSENIGAVLNKGDITVTFRPEADDEYSWPFIITSKNGEDCLATSNAEIESSYAILYMDVTLKAGQAVGFDYLASTENGADIMHVIVDDEPIFAISGADEKEQWKSCYPLVATRDDTYEIALCYYKDEDTNVGEDTVYIKDLRIVDVDDIDSVSYLPRKAANEVDGVFQYVDTFFNTKDGYYHVGSQNGPLLLVDMMGYTQFIDEQTLWDLVYETDVTVDGQNLYEAMVDYFSYASNSSLNGVCTVNGELAEYLKVVAEQFGFDGTEQEWLKMCKYYQAYGKGATQLEDPISGLAPFSAPEAKLGKNVSTNFFYYNTAIIPRGKLMKFVPSKSGVYRITSRNDSQEGVDGWIFDGDLNELLVYQQDERMYNDSNNVSMVYYMRAGEAYYIDIAFWDLYEVGYIYFDIEYVAATMDLFRLASPGPFTFDTDESGEAMYHTIAGGIDVALGEDGYYHHVVSKDENGQPTKLGSIVYADFIGVTNLYSNPIVTVDAKDENGNVIRDENGNVVKVSGMIDMGGFDFSKTEEDLYILAIMKTHGNDIEATDAYLRETWGEDYEANAQEYQIKDVFAGKYHGKGEDLTKDIKAYVSKMYSGSATERVGCVAVDQRLAEILQMLMDKYTFKDVDHSWTKLCYYYDHLGPEA